MPGMSQIFYQSGELGVGDGYYQFSVDGEPSDNYRKIIACYPIKYTVIILEPDKINLAV